MNANQSSGDSGSGDPDYGVQPNDGDPFVQLGGGVSRVSVGHTWLIVAGALALLWLFGARLLKAVRM